MGEYLFLMYPDLSRLTKIVADQAIIEVTDLVKHFPQTKGVLLRKQLGVVRAVDGISFGLQRGETLGLVGESGCGKTTTARLLAHLLQPTSGTVRFQGQSVSSLRGQALTQFRRELQLIFQDPYTSLNPRHTVGTIIVEPYAIHKLQRGRHQRRLAVQELMERVGLNPEHYNRYPHEFSGGQRQRIAIARALALRPKVIVADEPVSALDVSIQAQILNLLGQLQREFGLTMILIAHDLAVVHHMCDRVAVMRQGKIVELAKVNELYTRPRHTYTKALLAAVPTLFLID
jgi:ABC-type oligopeptide transport system ATPase subunit